MMLEPHSTIHLLDEYGTYEVLDASHSRSFSPLICLLMLRLTYDAESHDLLTRDILGEGV